MILIIDFGSQYNQLIARRLRENHVFCRIVPPTIPLETIRSLEPEGIVLSGGPSSIYENHSPRVDPALYSMGIPVLGICYGMQLMTAALGGEVERAAKREYGFARLAISDPEGLFKGIGAETTCWMSHGDSIRKLPRGFHGTAATANTPYAAAADPRKKLFGVQFHPEVDHTPEGGAMLRNFLFDICGCSPAWTMKSFAQEAVAEIRESVGRKKVILGLSGGVDSSVAAVLIHQESGKA